MIPHRLFVSRRPLAGLGVAIAALVLGAAAAAQGPLPGAYRISSRSSGKCLDAERGSRVAGSRVQEWDCHGGLNQRFRLVQLGDKWVVRVMHSDLCLSVTPAGRLIQADCLGDSTQLFLFEAIGEGEYRIEQGGDCLEVRETDSLTAAELDPNAFSVSPQSCADRRIDSQAWDLW